MLCLCLLHYSYFCRTSTEFQRLQLVFYGWISAVVLQWLCSSSRNASYPLHLCQHPSCCTLAVDKCSITSHHQVRADVQFCPTVFHEGIFQPRQQLYCAILLWENGEMTVLADVCHYISSSESLHLCCLAFDYNSVFCLQSYETSRI